MVLKEIIFLAVLSVGSMNQMADKVSVDIELPGPVDAKNISIIVKVKNLSGSSIKVLKNRRKDYKREKIKSLGNYIVEIQKLESGQFLLFPPSADIDPVFDIAEYIQIGKGQTITDTLYVNGSTFSENGSKGFPQGGYRLRVSFSSNEWNSAQINNSNWVYFKIE